MKTIITVATTLLQKAATHEKSLQIDHNNLLTHSVWEV